MDTNINIKSNTKFDVTLQNINNKFLHFVYDLNSYSSFFINFEIKKRIK